MAEGDAMEAAQETADKLNDQAAALREGKPPLSLNPLRTHLLQDISQHHSV